ncbi:MAG TPA: ShlB/FhaC/HecB family hemolysin secretion/activation protein [Allosphingosinicella sp.]|nr:ShlB/FhaC/HecB family hemolysin secretion/activation protein [Allosphingosinicella sp.]
MAGLLLAGEARAQVVPVPLPPPADLTRPQAPIRAPGAMLRVTPAPEGVMPPGAETTMIDVAAIDLTGVTVYDRAALQPDYAGLIGRHVPLAELFRAAARIEAHYRRDGYVLTRAIVPAQEAAGGHYRIEVVEGYVSDVEVTGAGGSEAALIRRTLAPVTRMRPVTIGAIERALLLVQQLPGVAAHAVLTPAAGTPGAARLVVDVRLRPVDAYATLDNRGSRFAGPITGAAGFGINGIGGFGGHLGGLYFTTFNREQNYGELHADARVGASGLTVRAFASYAISHPGSILAPLDISSTDSVFGIGADYPLLLTRRASVTLHGSFEATRDRTDLLGLPDSLDRQRILRIGFNAQAVDSWQGVSSFSITAHQGLNILGASHDGGAIPQSRLGGRSDFFKLTATASRFQPLATTPWGGLALQVSVAGQYAADKLLTLEQFHVGGESFGRGFNPSQFSGDDGAAADMELQLTHARAIGPMTSQQLYTFFDAASVHDRGIPGWTQIDSYGGGLRFDLGPHLSGQIEVAVPYRIGRQVGARLDRGAQGFFRLTARF